MEFDELSNRILGCALEVHRRLGPGLLESSYEACLAHELNLAGIPFQLQVPLPIEYRDIKLESGYRLDVVFDKSVLIELKSVEQLLPLHHAQVLTYLKLSGLHVALLINFNSVRLKDGIKRFVL
jgi:GxxExxY protein